MCEPSEHSDDNELLLEEERFMKYNGFPAQDEFSFLWFITKIFSRIREINRLNCNLMKQNNFSYFLQLLSGFVIFLISTIIGAIHLNTCNNERMICIYLIVEGVTGLVAIFFYIGLTTLRFMSKTKTSDLNAGQFIIKIIYIFNHILTSFCVIWFFIGHIWIFQSLNRSSQETACKTNITKITIIIFIIEYIIALWYLTIRLWNSPYILSYIQNKIQNQLDHIVINTNIEINENSESRNRCSSDGVPVSTVNRTHLLFFIFGLLVCGIPLFIVTDIRTNTINGVLPTQCYAYTTNPNSIRHFAHGSCCSEGNGIETGWYRFIGGSGTQLINRQLNSTGICGVAYPGWWNGTLPKKRGETSVGNICFYTGNACDYPLSPISATNCGDYYVFYLRNLPCCSYGYCTE